MLREMEIRDILNEGLKSKDVRILIASVKHAISLLDDWIEQEMRWADEEYQNFLKESKKTLLKN